MIGLFLATSWADPSVYVRRKPGGDTYLVLDSREEDAPVGFAKVVAECLTEKDATAVLCARTVKDWADTVNFVLIANGKTPVRRSRSRCP